MLKFSFPAMLAVAMMFAAMTSADAQPGGRGGRGGFGFGGGGRGGPAALISMPEVQKELAITDDQKTLINEMQEDLRGQGGQRPDFGSFRDMSEAEREKAMAEMRKRGEERNKQAEDALKVILSDTQFARYNELQIQRQGLMALTRPDVSEKLALSKEQTDKIESLREAARPERGQFGGGRRPEGQPEGERPDFRAMMEQARERQQKLEADTLAVLTPEQKTKWEQMQGKKFDFPQPSFGGRDGGGRGRGEGGNRPPRGERPESN